MSLFDVIHNTITDHAIVVGPITTIDCTPTELAKAIETALQLKEEHHKNQQRLSRTFRTWTRWATPWVEGPTWTDERLPKGRNDA